ncbi:MULTISPECIES: DUF4190 domain-containing protein [Bacteria]
MSDANGPADHTPPPPAHPTAPSAPASAAPGAPVPGKTLGIVALIVAFFANVIGLILGIVALVQSRKAGYKNTPAVWAIIVGSVLAVVGVILLVVLISVFAAGAGELLQQCAELGPGTWTLDNGATVTCG